MSSIAIKVGVNTFVIQNGKILLGKRLAKAGYGMWGLPGGHLEAGEDLLEAAKRELREETDLNATKIEFLQLINDPREDQHYIQINFLVREWTGEVKLMEPNKCEQWNWFELDSLPEPIFYGHAKFIPAFKNGINFIS